LKKLEAVALILVLGTGIYTWVPAQASSKGNEHTPVTLCHWVPAHGGSYVTITVDDDGARGNKNLKGHSFHGKDIIPAPAEGCPAVNPKPNVPTLTPTATAGVNTPTTTPTSVGKTPTATPVKTQVASPTPTIRVEVPVTPTRVVDSPGTAVFMPTRIAETPIRLPNTGSGKQVEQDNSFVLFIFAGLISSFVLVVVAWLVYLQIKYPHRD
jgi:hypothetical protein